MVFTNKSSTKRKARRITPDYLHNAALYYLERYAASEGRVRRVLAQKIKRSCRDHPDQVESDLLGLIDAEIETLRRVQLIDDAALAQGFVTGYRARGMPARMIAIKLKQRGLSANLIDDLLRALDQGEDTKDTEQDAAIRYLKRRALWPYLKNPVTDPAAQSKAKQKSWAALARQGYDPDLIKAAMIKPTEGI